MKHSSSIPAKKDLDQITWTLSFFQYYGIFSQKLLSARKKLVTENNFRCRYFLLKYGLKHSESIPTEKRFQTPFLTLKRFHYLGHFDQKMTNPRKEFVRGQNT